MNIPKNPYLLIIPVILCILTSCRSDINKVKETAAMYEPSKETGYDIEMLYSDWGNIKIKLLAPVVVRHQTENPYLEFPKGLHLYFYDEQMNVESELQAKYAIRYENIQQTIFRDSVHIENVKNETMDSEELIWDEKNERIYSNKLVKVVTPEERITGTGFTAAQDFSSYKFTNITAIFNVSTDKIDEDL